MPILPSGGAMEAWAAAICEFSFFPSAAHERGLAATTPATAVPERNARRLTPTLEYLHDMADLLERSNGQPSNQANRAGLADEPGNDISPSSASVCLEIILYSGLTIFDLLPHVTIFSLPGCSYRGVEFVNPA